MRVNLFNINLESESLTRGDFFRSGINMFNNIFILILLNIYIPQIANQNNIDKAQKLYNEGLEFYNLANPRDAVSYEYLESLEESYALYGRDRDKLLINSVSSFHKAIEFNSKFAKAYNGLGNAYRELNMNSKAFDAFNNAGLVDSTYPWGYKNFGDLKLRNKSYGEAISAYREFLQIDQKYSRSEVHYKLGMIFEELGQFQLALNEFRVARDEGAPKGIWRNKAEKILQEFDNRKIE